MKARGNPPIKRGDFFPVGAKLPPDFASSHALLNIREKRPLTEREKAELGELIYENDILWWKTQGVLVTRYENPPNIGLVPLDDALMIYLLGLIPNTLKTLDDPDFGFEDGRDKQAVIEEIIMTLADDPISAQQAALEASDDLIYIS